MLELATIIEQSLLAQALAGSVWWYPLVNAGHILGIALLVGGILPLDLRLLGLWSSLPLQPLWRMLRTTAAMGLALAMITGGLMFIARATEYVQSFWFRAKILVLVLALINILVITLRYSSVAAAGDSRLTPSAGLRAGALVSMVAWLIMLVLGRLVGYF